MNKSNQLKLAADHLAADHLAADHLAAENTDSSVMPKSKDTHDKAAGAAPPVPYLANALTLFARHLGVEVTTDAFLRGLPISGHDLDETLVSRAMDKIGCDQQGWWV